MVAEICQIHCVKITGKYICESKSWIVFLVIASPISYKHRSRQKDPQKLFLKIQAEKGEDPIVEKMTKYKLARVLVTFLINSAVIATFTFLVSVLLYHKLGSRTLNCEGYLTWILWFSLKSMVWRNNYMKDKIFPYPIF